MPLTVRCGSLMVNPSSPLARISRVTLERTAPGAKERFQSAVACWPVSGLAPDASRRTHPVSLLPSSGHETPLGSAWAETVDKVNNGLMDIKSMRATIETAFRRFCERPCARFALFMKETGLSPYLKQALD